MGIEMVLIVQNIFFCAQQKKEKQIWNNLRESKWQYSFGVY